MKQISRNHYHEAATKAAERAILGYIQIGEPVYVISDSTGKISKMSFAKVYMREEKYGASNFKCDIVAETSDGRKVYFEIMNTNDFRKNKEKLHAIQSQNCLVLYLDIRTCVQNFTLSELPDAITSTIIYQGFRTL